MHAFDGRTDRRTDRIPIAIPRLHSMQRGNKLLILTNMHYALFKVVKTESMALV